MREALAEQGHGGKLWLSAFFFWHLQPWKMIAASSGRWSQSLKRWPLWRVCLLHPQHRTLAWAPGGCAAPWRWPRGLHPDCRLGKNRGREGAGLQRGCSAGGGGGQGQPLPTGRWGLASGQEPPTQSESVATTLSHSAPSGNSLPQGRRQLLWLFRQNWNRSAWVGIPLFHLQAAPQTGLESWPPWTTEGGLARRLTWTALRTPQSGIAHEFYSRSGDKNLIPPLSRLNVKNEEVCANRICRFSKV